VKSEVSGELISEVDTEVVIREEGGRRVEDVFMGGNIWVLEYRGKEFSYEFESTVMHAQAGGDWSETLP